MEVGIAADILKVWKELDAVLVAVVEPLGILGKGLHCLWTQLKYGIGEMEEEEMRKDTLTRNISSAES